MKINNINDLSDMLLDKINENGFNNLSKYEIDILNKISNNDVINLKEVLSKINKKSNNKPKSKSNNKQKAVYMRYPSKSLKINDIVYPLFYVSTYKLPEYAKDYLKSSKSFIIKKIKNNKVDIGCRNNGKIFYFSSKRFTTEEEKEFDIDDITVDIDNDDNNDNNNWDEYNKANNQPNDYYFDVMEYDDIVMVCLTSVKYFDKFGGLDDGLGYHNLSDSIKKSFKKIGICLYEEMEAMWSSKKSKNETIKGLIDEGFVNSVNFKNSIN